MSNVADSTEVSANSTYSALLLGKASSKGCACALAALCESAGLEWRIVSGTLAGGEHYWNMVRIDGNWYHADISMRGDAKYMTDSEIHDGYGWQITAYPLCSGEPFVIEPEIPPHTADTADVTETSVPEPNTDIEGGSSILP